MYRRKLKPWQDAYEEVLDPTLNWILANAEGTEVCWIDKFGNGVRTMRFFSIVVCGVKLMYIANNLDGGKRCYLINDDLCKLLGFKDPRHLREVLRIRARTRFLSLTRLRQGLSKWVWSRLVDDMFARENGENIPRKKSIRKMPKS